MKQKAFLAMFGRGLSVLGLALVAGSFAVGCGSAGDSQLGDSTDDVTKTVYANLYEVAQGTDLDDWLTARDTLKHDFYQICGDTMCDGDFRNWNTVTLDCSASKNTKKLSQCLWTFAGSQEFANGSSGKITSDIPVIQCTIPVKGTITDFLKGLKAAAPNPMIQSVVPGGTKTYYDYVANCFENVPEKIPTPTKTQTYKTASLTIGNDNPDGWYPGVDAIDNGFDQICGDTFCEGDYSDIDALGFDCAVSNAGNVKNCALSLAGAYTEVGSYGVITAHTKTWTCPIPFAGKTATLVSFMAGTDPYNAPLPGGTSTIHDSLVNCL